MKNVNELSKCFVLIVMFFMLVGFSMPPVLASEDYIVEKEIKKDTLTSGKWAKVEKIEKISLLSNGGSGETKLKKRFPRIDGLINLYDSVPVAGDIKNVTVHLDYNYSLGNKLYFTLGGKNIYDSVAFNNTSKGNVTVDIIIPNGTDYSPFANETEFKEVLSNTTVPFVFSTESADALPADIVLITDLSNSMQECMNFTEGVGEELTVDPYMSVLYNFNNDQIYYDGGSGTYDVYDQTSNALNATCIAGRCPVFGSAYGLFGDAFRFCKDCTSGTKYENYLYMSKDNPNIRGVKMNSYDDWTLELWFRAPESIGSTMLLAGDPVWIGTQNDYPWGGRGITLRVNSDRDGIIATTDATGGGVQLNADKNLGNDYHHVTWTRELVPGLSNNVYEKHVLYLDGEVMDQEFIMPKAVESTVDFRMGYTGSAGVSRYFKGDIDDFAVYKKALTPEEIQVRYQGYIHCPPDFESSSELDPDLVAWWKFDDRYGTTTSEDFVGNNDASCSGDSCPYAITNGKYGSALKFDGSNDFIEVVNDDKLDVSEMSISLWINPGSSTSGTWRRIIAAPTEFNNEYVLIYRSSDDTLILSKDGDIAKTGAVLGLVEDSWQYVVAGFDSSDSPFIYINGAEQTLSDPGTVAGRTSGNFRIGLRQDGYGSYYGLIDDLRIYNKTLTQEEISELYNSGDKYSPSACEYKIGTECPQNCDLWRSGHEERYCYEFTDNEDYRYGFESQTEDANRSVNRWQCDMGRIAPCEDPHDIEVDKDYSSYIDCPDYINCVDTTCPPSYNFTGEPINATIEPIKDCTLNRYDPSSYPDCPPGYPLDINDFPRYNSKTDNYCNCSEGWIDDGPSCFSSEWVIKDECDAGFSMCSTNPTYNESNTVVIDYEWNPVGGCRTNCNTSEFKYGTWLGDQECADYGLENCDSNREWCPGISEDEICCCDPTSLLEKCEVHNEQCCPSTPRDCYRDIKYCYEKMRCYSSVSYDCCSYGCLPTTYTEDSCTEGYGGSGIPEYPDNYCSTERCKKVEKQCAVCEYVAERLAKKVDQEFVENILTKAPSSNISLISYGDTTDVSNFSNDAIEINNNINNYIANMGETCISCALKEAINQLALSIRERQFIVLMSDGEANVKYNSSYPGTASEEAINIACTELTNVTIYTVGFGSGAGESTLISIANCSNNGTYFPATNPENISEIYGTIAEQIITSIQQNKEINITGEPDILYDSSYIEVTYDALEKSYSGLIPITQEKIFSSCGQNLTFNPGEIIDNIFLTSYSGNYWIADLTVENNTGDKDVVYSISDYGNDYVRIGDPYQMLILTEVLSNLSLDYEREFSMVYHDIDKQIVGVNCSNNKLIYDAMLDLFVTQYSFIAEMAEGCNWTVEFPDGSNRSFEIPVNASQQCYYNQINHTTSTSLANDTDVYQQAFFSLLELLDVDGDGVVDYYFDQDDFSVDLKTVEEIPYMWGPGILEVSVWQE